MLVCRTAQENGEYAEAFWLCAQCCRQLEAMQHLRISTELLAAVDAAYRATTRRLEEALQALCRAFRAEAYYKVTPEPLILRKLLGHPGSAQNCTTEP